MDEHQEERERECVICDDREERRDDEDELVCEDEEVGMNDVDL